jgi:hypothetical protein
MVCSGGGGEGGEVGGSCWPTFEWQKQLSVSGGYTRALLQRESHCIKAENISVRTGSLVMVMDSPVVSQSRAKQKSSEFKALHFFTNPTVRTRTSRPSFVQPSSK